MFCSKMNSRAVLSLSLSVSPIIYLCDSLSLCVPRKEVKITYEHQRWKLTKCKYGKLTFFFFFLHFYSVHLYTDIWTMYFSSWKMPVQLLC